MAEVPNNKPVRKRLNANQRRQIKTAAIKRFVQAYGRRPGKGNMACDRQMDQKPKKKSAECRQKNWTASFARTKISMPLSSAFAKCGAQYFG